MRVRFDDLRPGHTRSFGFGEPVDVIAAVELPDVVPALANVEAAAAAGRWCAGFISYEAAPAFDRSLRTREPVAGLPLVWFGVFDEVLDTADEAGPAGYRLGPWTETTGITAYVAAVDQIRERIRQGDTYQVNYTTRMRSHLEGDPIGWYLDLVAAQSGGYGAFLDTGRFQVVSASPELFFDWNDRKIVTKPMKGTARRGRWPAEDDTLREALEASPKDRAENLMIVDLLRNDLGRVAATGSVQVDRLFEAERFDTIWQLTSTISATTRPEVGLVGVFAALFPCGSVTGAPKASTMGIIAATETEPRGLYTGAIGFVEPGARRAVFSVAIRTAVHDGETGIVEYGVGGGVTYDSDPGGEYNEALAKAVVLERAGRTVELLETMRWEPGEGVALLAGHLDRLAGSAAYFGIPVDFEKVRSEVAMCAAPVPSRLRLVVDRHGRFTLESEPAPQGSGVVTLVVDREPVDRYDPFLFHKTTNRAPYDARLARHPEADDVVLINESGEVTETAIANLLVRLDEGWVTPPIDSGCLPGVARARLVADGAVTERSVTIDELQRADEIEVVNALRGRRKARLLSG
ncbi:MAG: aminodeoxychorismate synthase component I [Acidimicrobiia bacterium]|nr:aminodeoxychorismate synthase component I [Acidimicrobiia bacterium]